MEIKILFGAIAVICAFASAGTYYVSILQGKSKPHLFTRLVFAILETIVFFGQFVSGGGIGAWVTGISALFQIGIVILSLKYGTKDVAFTDKISFSLALLCIVIWLIVKNPFWSVLLAVVIDFGAMIPTYRKTWFAPESEALISWLLGTLKYFLSIFALSTYSLVTYIYPVEVVAANAILIGIILYRRKQLATARFAILDP
jgi:hypothetical protein